MSSSQDIPGHTGAWRSVRAWVGLLVVMVTAITTDLVSKELAFARIAGEPVPVHAEDVLRAAAEDPRHVSSLVPEHDPVLVVPYLLELKLVLNPGAVFGIGPGERGFFIGFTLVALVFGLWMFARWTGPNDFWSHAGIGLLLGGGLGNLYDRIVHACVRDFLHPLPGVKFPFGWKPLGGSGEVWPYVSNLADLYLLIGIFILLVVLWRRDTQKLDEELPE